MNEVDVEAIEVVASDGSGAKGMRFCGRCQQWVPDVVELHYCVKSPRALAYGWYEPDEPAVEKNSILQDGKPAKRGALIATFTSEAKHIEEFPNAELAI